MKKLLRCDKVLGREWNPIIGCSPTSPGCKNCYARDLHSWLTRLKRPGYDQPFNKVRFMPDRLDLPLKWKETKEIFVCSMSDLFWDDVPDNFIQKIFDTLKSTPNKSYQVLTKRSQRMMDFSIKYGWPLNAWAGVSVENKEYLFRIDHLRKITAKRFISFEPLLEGIGEIDLGGIDWVMLGGESGKHAKPFNDDWARSIRDQCIAMGIPFCFKQRQRVKRREKNFPLLDGEIWNQLPRW